MPTHSYSVASHLPDVGAIIFTIVSALANECGAVNPSQGFPDFDCPPPLLDRVIHYVKTGNNQYGP